MYNDTVTLFNRKAGRTGDIWYPTVLCNVQLIVDKSAILAKYGAEAQDRATLHVRYDFHDGGKKMVGQKQWLPNREWIALDDPSHAVTFSDGVAFDFFWWGDWGNETPVKDADYLSTGDFYSYMKQKYDYVFSISSVGGPYRAIPHFEIIGK